MNEVGVRPISSFVVCQEHNLDRCGMKGAVLFVPRADWGPGKGIFSSEISHTAESVRERVGPFVERKTDSFVAWR